jgi:hypothetical protein
MKQFGLLAIVLAVQLHAQGHASDGASIPKDAKRATLLSVVFPGGGQFYTGETDHAVAFMVGALGSVGLGAALSHGYQPAVYAPGNPIIGPVKTSSEKAADWAPLRARVRRVR